MINKEGYIIFTISFIILTALCIFTRILLPGLSTLVLLLSGILYVFLLSFFRNPVRKLPKANDNILYAPADGKIVVNEDTVETAYLNKEMRMALICYFYFHFNSL